MSGIDYLVDTNAIIYLLAGKSCMESFKNNLLGVSVISEMELLSFPRITNQEINLLENLLGKCVIFSLSDEIKKQAIFFRRTYGMKLPDAIVAATAQVQNIPLITADKDFLRIANLNLCLLNP